MSASADEKQEEIHFYLRQETREKGALSAEYRRQRSFLCTWGGEEMWPFARPRPGTTSRGGRPPLLDLAADSTKQHSAL